MAPKKPRGSSVVLFNLQSTRLLEDGKEEEEEEEEGEEESEEEEEEVSPFNSLDQLSAFKLATLRFRFNAAASDVSSPQSAPCSPLP